MKPYFLVILVLVSLISCKTVAKHIKHSKHKRGVLGGGYHGLGHTHFGTTGFGVNPLRYANHWTPSVYSNFQAFAKPLAPTFPAAPYALTHGDASVQSYNVNYPRYPLVHQKPIFAQPTSFAQNPVIPQYFQTFQGQYPQFVQAAQPFLPAPAPIQPVLPAAAPLPIPAPAPAPVFPQFFIPQKPIIPVAVPAVPAVQTLHRPLFVQKPIVPVQPSFNLNPVFSIASFQPQFVPIPIPTQPSIGTNTVGTTITTTAPTQPTTTTTTTTQQPNQVVGQSGTNFVTSINPGQSSWQPMMNTGGTSTHFLPTPTVPTGQNFPRPPISLLPPYLGPTGPGFGTNFIGAFTSTNAPTTVMGGNIDEQHNNNHEFIQGNNGNQQHHQVNHQGYPSGPFNGQAYGPPANNGRFTGPSSYQVRLNTRREY